MGFFPDQAFNIAFAEYGDQIISVQAHPAFRKGYIEGLVREKGKGTYKSDAEAEAARDSLATPIDADIVQKRMRDFIRGR